MRDCDMKGYPAGRNKRYLAVFMMAMFAVDMVFAQATMSDGPCHHDWSPLSVAMVPAVEFPLEGWDVYGVRVNVFAGKHHDIGGIDIGSIANLATGDVIGLQASCIFARTLNTLTGCQIAPISLVGTLEGIQIGVFNRTEGLWGLQIGVVNYAYQANGVQIGLLNVIADSELPILPIVNIGF